MKVIQCAQGSEAWFEARLGKVTASEVCDAVRFLKRGEKKGEESKSRSAYKAAIVAEILTGRPADTFVSRYMQYGTEMEPLARAAYEVRFGVEVDRVGFVLHPTIDRAGASPDGLVGKEGGVEIKCPKTETHLDYMLAGVVPPEYEPQVMFNLACAEREWWDFVSFDLRLPPRHQVFRVRVRRDEKRIAELNEGVRQFLAEVDELIERLNTMNPEMALQEQLRESLRQDDSFGITAEDIAWIESKHEEAAR